ncbi:probable G-protein coupled receptor 141 [Boleophthalmus pectinirostris]|uniref:probable G-protein coupled receptor 141 n=1 Tax=Boleophthalmus pectinirostris TaxID=150288 RepID=UPI0024325BA2|nr:probable G-protein coupled receptor 141 [Boleophthalmus pectinirostris]
MYTNVSLNSTAVPDEFHNVLLGIYSCVFISGLICFILTVQVLKPSTTSLTSIAVFNLIFTHFVFLLTVPFRIYYYYTHQWKLGLDWCKVISSMIHVHMYMSFIFYVIILISRLLSFYNKAENMPSIRRLHGLLVSAAVWIIVLVSAPCVVSSFYGTKAQGKKGNETCFTFGEDIEPTTAKVFNYIVSTFIIVATTVLTVLQAKVLLDLYKKVGDKCTLQQEFGAQLKSLCFALIMVASFIPYHIFRLYYIEHLNLENVNEVFLSLTTFNCLDALTFLGRRTCFGCYFCKGLS